MQRITNDLFESIRKVSAAAQEATPTILNEETVQEDYTKEADEIISEMTEEDFAESLEEAKMDYSAKKARAGKDIGKPGKMFGKIAASAAKRYGSAEKGKKVAGAVLAKLRAESMEEEVEQIDELSPSTLTSYRHKARNSELRNKETARRDTEISQQTTNPRVAAKSAAYAAKAQATADKRRAGQLKATSRLSNEEVERTDEAMSHQAKTTMKHISNPTPGEKKAAKDIKPGIAGYRDRVAMLKSAKARGGLKEEETITMEFVIENTIEVSVPSTITYQDYINAIKTIVNSEDPEIQAEIVSIANEAFTNNNIEVIAEAELIKQGIIEADYKATRMGDKQYSPELNLDVDRTKPGVTRVSRRIRSGEGKGTTATERRTMKRIASRTK